MTSRATRAFVPRIRLPIKGNSEHVPWNVSTEDGLIEIDEDHRDLRLTSVQDLAVKVDFIDDTLNHKKARARTQRFIQM